MKRIRIGRLPWLACRWANGATCTTTNAFKQ